MAALSASFELRSGPLRAAPLVSPFPPALIW
jgi:hypothetical protein